MFKKLLAVALVATIAACLAGTASADIVSPDSSYCSVVFTKTYSQNYNKGQPYDYVTIAPNGSPPGETLSQAGITIHVTLRNSAGQPLAGVPLQQINLFNSALCICTGGSSADAATDINGHTTFTGTIRGGGCVTQLDVFADGVKVCSLPSGAGGVHINSVDNGVASPCFTDASDLAELATRLGVAIKYAICWDYNESGPPTIDASDLAFFAGALGGLCN